MERISIKRKFMEPVKLILAEAFDNTLPKKNKYSFTAVVLVWDPVLDYEWSIVSRNGVRYHREYSVRNFKAAVKHNNGIPFLYNHIMENDKIEQLGLVTEIEDTGKEMVVKGYLNGNKTRVVEEILTGFLNNVSLQVDGDRFEVEEGGEHVTYAKPTDVYEISAVPVQGIAGANMFDICLCEAVKAQRDKELVTNKDDDGKADEEEIITLEATSSSVGGAIGTALHGRDEETKSISKDEIEDELSTIEDNDKESLDAIFNEAADEIRYDELFKESVKAVS